MKNKERKMKPYQPFKDFKPIHLFDHSTNESFQIVSREGLIDWINEYTENHNAFDTYEELREKLS